MAMQELSVSHDAEAQVCAAMNAAYKKYSEPGFEEKLDKALTRLPRLLDRELTKKMHDVNALDNYQLTLSAVEWVTQRAVEGAFGITFLVTSSVVTASTLGAGSVFVPLIAVGTGLGAHFTNRGVGLFTLALRQVNRRTVTWMEHKEKLFEGSLKEAGLNLDMVRLDASESIRLAALHFANARKLRDKLESFRVRPITSDGEAEKAVRLYMEFVHQIRRAENYLCPCLDFVICVLDRYVEACSSCNKAIVPVMEEVRGFFKKGDHSRCRVPETCLQNNAAQGEKAQASPSAKAQTDASEMLKPVEQQFQQMKDELMALRNFLFSDYQKRYETAELEIERPRRPGGIEVRKSEWAAMELGWQQAFHLYSYVLHDIESPLPHQRARNKVRNALKRLTGLEIAVTLGREALSATLVAGTAAVTSSVGQAGLANSAAAATGGWLATAAQTGVQTVVSNTLSPVSGQISGTVGHAASQAVSSTGNALAPSAQAVTNKVADWVQTTTARAVAGTLQKVPEWTGQKAADLVQWLIAQGYQIPINVAQNAPFQLVQLGSDKYMDSKWEKFLTGNTGNFFKLAERHKTIQGFLESVASPKRSGEGKTKYIAKKLSDSEFEAAARRLYKAWVHLNAFLGTGEDEEIHSCSMAQERIDHVAGFIFNMDVSWGKLDRCIDLIQGIALSLFDLRRETDPYWENIRKAVEVYFRFERETKKHPRMRSEEE